MSDEQQVVGNRPEDLAALAKREPIIRVDVTRATSLKNGVNAEIDAMFTYQPWNQLQVENGAQVRLALAHAVKVIVLCVPPSADRSAAIRKLREARMDCNAAITSRGKY